MLIRLIRKYKNSDEKFSDYELVDVLRALSQQNRDGVINREWLVSELDYFAYNDDFQTDRLQFLFPELDLSDGESAALVRGERLLERSALIHILESGLFLRLADTDERIVVNTQYRLDNGPSYFQATNTDLEIRRCEAPIEVVTEDEDVIAHLQGIFEVTEIEP